MTTLIDLLLETESAKETLLKMFKRPTTVHFTGRRWFDRRVGATYHTVDVYLDDKLDTTLGPARGYGNQYMETAMQYLEARKIIPPRPRGNGGYASPWRWFEQLGIGFTQDVYDVKRKRDL